MVIRDKLEEVQAAIEEANGNAAMEEPARAVGWSSSNPTVFSPLEISRFCNVDAIWSARGKHALTGRIDAELKGSKLVITHPASGTVLYEGDGDGVGIRDEDEFPARYTLFLDKFGHAQEAMAKGLITRREVEETYFDTPKGKEAFVLAAAKLGIQQSYVEWDFGNAKLDPNMQLSALKRLIEDKVGDLVTGRYALDCGRNFRHGIEKLPMVQDAFQSWKELTGAPADKDVPADFILADNVLVREAFDEANNAYLYPEGIDRTRLRECSVKIVGLNAPAAPVRAEDVEALREAVEHLASWQGVGDATFNDMADNVNILRLRIEKLEAEIAALKGTPPKPSDADVLDRAMGAHR